MNRKTQLLACKRPLRPPQKMFPDLIFFEYSWRPTESVRAWTHAACSGPSGSGKTALVGELLRKRQNEGNLQTISQTFLSHMQPAALQSLLETRLETKRKALVSF